MVMMQVLILLAVLALKNLLQLPSPLITLFTSQGSCTIPVHVCITAMLLVKITEVHLLWCKLICMMDMLKPVI
jgi:hypothetical protein